MAFGEAERGVGGSGLRQPAGRGVLPGVLELDGGVGGAVREGAGGAVEPVGQQVEAGAGAEFEQPDGERPGREDPQQAGDQQVRAADLVGLRRPGQPVAHPGEVRGDDGAEGRPRGLGTGGREPAARARVVRRELRRAAGQHQRVHAAEQPQGDGVRTRGAHVPGEGLGARAVGRDVAGDPVEQGRVQR